MKIMYNEHEVANTNRSYTTLSDKPSINNIVLDGTMALSDIHVYSKREVDNLIAATRAIRQVAELPSETESNTMYYVGPNSEGKYDVYLYDSDNNPISLGSSDVEIYRPGLGIYLDTNYNTLNANVGKFLKVDSEGTYANKISVDAATVINSASDNNHVATGGAVYNFVMSGATASAAGKRGAVPAPTASERTYFLRGDGKWTKIATSGGLTTDANNVVKHSNSITANTSANLGTFSYDSYGHITGFTARPVINNLTSTSTVQPLSAYQGKVLNDKFNDYVKYTDVVDNCSSGSTNLPLSANQGRLLYNRVVAAEKLVNFAVECNKGFQLGKGGSFTHSFTTYVPAVKIVVTRDSKAYIAVWDGWGAYCIVKNDFGSAVSVSVSRNSNMITSVKVSSSYTWAVRGMITAAMSW